MSITKFPAASVAAFLLAPCAHAQTETRLPDVGVIAPCEGAQGYVPPVAFTGAKPAAPLDELAAPVVVIPKEAPRAKRCASGRRVLQRIQLITVRHVPVTPPGRRAFS